MLWVCISVLGGREKASLASTNSILNNPALDGGYTKYIAAEKLTFMVDFLYYFPSMNHLGGS